jgi:GTP-binding protein Era
VVAINKIDLVPKPQLLPIVEHYTHAGFAPVIPVSALLRDGIPELLAALRELLPEGEPYYPSDQLTTQPERFFVQELLREAVFRNFGAEIPYATLVEVTEFREQPGRKTLIRASVFVERDSQKAIVIGLRGEALKRLGSHARHDIEAFLEGPVFLELTVKVRPGWRKDQAFLRERFRES